MSNALALPNVSTARLPTVYEQAKQSLAQCQRIDECAEWANRAEALASYARQSEDDSLLNFATKIKARAITRCGELLKEIEAPANRNLLRGEDAPPSGATRESVASAAGLSKHQMKQAIRCANVPADERERMLERPKPATLTELAQRGKKPSTSHLKGRDPKDFAASTQGQGAVRAFVAKACPLDPRVVVRGTTPGEYGDLSSNAKQAVAWLQRLQSELRKVRR